MHNFAARALGGGVNYRDNSEMAAMIREQQEQVALEQQLMQQQDVIKYVDYWISVIIDICLAN